ncbi:MAG: 50S ribosomal protein L15 [Vicinamibacteria bacterium]|nr:50S ribosomal protein L15 [Vicinamibacteria bacterium]
MGLNALKPADGSIRERRRVGRGPGSGRGKTAGRGEKGQKSRSGYGRKVGFEGGQMPLHRRVPKRGFRNPRRREYSCVNLGSLERLEPGTIVTPEVLIREGIVRKLSGGLKILGNGELTKPLTVQAQKFSAKAVEAIAAVGGKAEVVGDRISEKR